MVVDHSFVFAVKYLQDVLYIGRFISPDRPQNDGGVGVAYEYLSG